MQRLGRKGRPVYRVVVQDSRQAPTSGKVVALLGSYDPHTKTTTLVKEKAEFYLNNGAQPSERVVKLFIDEKVKLPKWVEKPAKQKRDIRNPDKLRRNRPADQAQPADEQAEGASSSDEPDKAETKTVVAEAETTTDQQSSDNKDKGSDDSSTGEEASESSTESDTTEEAPKKDESEEKSA